MYIALSILLAAACLLIYAAATRQRPTVGRHWRRYLVMGLLNNAVPFTLISAAELRLSADQP